MHVSSCKRVRETFLEARPGRTQLQLLLPDACSTHRRTDVPTHCGGGMGRARDQGGDQGGLSTLEAAQDQGRREGRRLICFARGEIKVHTISGRQALELYVQAIVLESI